MKKNILLYFFLLHFASVFAGVRIKEFKHPNTYPYNGYILVEANDPQKPYTIVIKGMNSGYTKTVRDISTEYKFEPLGPDLYEIEVYGSTGCGIIKLSQLLSPCDRLKVTPVVKQPCRTSKSGDSPFVETKGSISLNITGGRAPFTYEWRNLNNSNQVFSREKDVSGLTNSTVRVIVKDQDGCMFMQDFVIAFFTLSTKTLRREDICYTQSDYITEMIPSGIKMQFRWSDGTVRKGFFDRKRLSNENTIYHSVTVTEPISQCSLTENIRMLKGDWVLEIKSLKHPSFKGVKDGSVTLLENLNGGHNGFILKPLKLVITRNGAYYRTDNWETSANRTFVVKNLEEGEYQFDWQDNFGCPIASAFTSLFACQGEIHNPTIEITDYSLPPSSPGAYARARASYGFGSLSECKYNWYSNYYNVTTTTEPFLPNDLIKNFYVSNNNKLCVKIICPCGEAESCVDFDPCHPDARFVFLKRDISSVCYGMLPTGKKITFKPKGKIDIEIDVNRYMDRGEQGLPEYNKRISSIKWADGAVVTNQFDLGSNRLRITREVDAAGEFKLIIVTGSGCTISELFKVENSFEINYSVDDKCIYRAKCKEDSGIGTLFNEGKLVNINFETCEGYIYCGENLIERVQGITEKGEYVVSPPNCKAKQWCIFTTIKAVLNEENNPGLLIYYTDPSNKELSPRRYAAVREINVDCCVGLGANEVFNKIELLNDNDLNIHVHVDLDNSNLNPCIGYIRCSNTGYYYTLVGTPISNYICQDKDGSCKRCITCSFIHSGESFSIKERCYPVKISECGDKVACPSVYTQEDSAFSRSRIQHKIVLSPNPFKDQLLIKYNTISSKSKNCIIEIFDGSGRMVNSTRFDIHESSSIEIIDTKDLAAGFYIIKCQFENEPSQSFKMIKI